MLLVHFWRLLSYLVGMLFRTVLVALYRMHWRHSPSLIASQDVTFGSAVKLRSPTVPLRRSVRFPATNDAVIAYRNKNGRLADNSLFASLGQSMKLLHVRALNRDNSRLTGNSQQIGIIKHTKKCRQRFLQMPGKPSAVEPTNSSTHVSN